MKLKYKKLIIVISIGALLLSFLILTLIPTGGESSNPIQDAALPKCTDENIINLINSYFQAKRDVNMEMMEPLVSDINQIDQEKLITQAEYVEDYRNIVCYSLKNEENGALRVYIRYDMKLKNIETLAPCLSGVYVTVGSDGKNLIYLSALEEHEEEFILAADKNSHVVELQEEVARKLQEAINADEGFKQLYQKMDQEIAMFAGKNGEPEAAATPAPDPNAAGQPAPDPNAAAQPTPDPNAANPPAADPNAAGQPAPDPNAANPPAADPNAAPAQ